MGPPVHPELAAYECLGFLVEQRCGRFAAYDTRKAFLGEFANQRAAIDAIQQALMKRLRLQVSPAAGGAP
jgi:hypothetical protein